MCSTTTAMNTTTSTEGESTSGIRIGTYEGTTSIEAQGEDFDPADVHSRLTTTVRRGTQQAKSATGESSTNARHSRPRERVTYAKKVANALAKAACMPQLCRGRLSRSLTGHAVDRGHDNDGCHFGVILDALTGSKC